MYAIYQLRLSCNLSSEIMIHTQSHGIELFAGAQSLDHRMLRGSTNPQASLNCALTTLTRDTIRSQLNIQLNFMTIASANGQWGNSPNPDHPGAGHPSRDSIHSKASQLAHPRRHVSRQFMNASIWQAKVQTGPNKVIYMKKTNKRKSAHKSIWNWS